MHLTSRPPQAAPVTQDLQSLVPESHPSPLTAIRAGNPVSHVLEANPHMHPRPPPPEAQPQPHP